MKLGVSTFLVATLVSDVFGLVPGSTAEGIPQQEQAPPFFRLDFDIHRGDSRSNMGKGRKPGLVKRDSFAMEVTNARTFYVTELEIGSRGDRVDILVDTGSSDLWVMSHDVNCHSVRTQTKRNVGSDTSKGGIHVGDTVVQPLQLDDTSKPTKSNNLDEFVHGKDLGDSILSIVGINTDSPQGPSGGTSGSNSGSSSGSGSGSGSNTCTSYGSFNTRESDSFNRNSSAPGFEILYADGTTAEGVWGHDDVRIHNVTVRDLSFAIANDTSSDIGVLGIGLPGLEVTYSQGGFNTYQYENLPLKLKNQGVIAKSVYSVYLGDEDSETGTILFGAVDHAKYKGTLRTVPIVNSMARYNYRDPIRLEINLSGLTLSEGTNSQSVTNNGYTALLDTGSTLSYFPRSLVSRLGSMLGLEYSRSVGAYLVNCNAGDDTFIHFDFSGINITLPINDFIMRVSGETCVLGILPQGSGSDYILLGDNFLRGAYVVFDLDDYTMSLAEANHVDREEIEVISSSIPRAETVSSAATVAYSGGSEASADSEFTLDEDNNRSSGDGSRFGVGYAALLVSLILGTMLV